MADRCPACGRRIEQAEREEAMADWLADHGLDVAIAEALADTAVTFEALDCAGRARSMDRRWTPCCGGPRPAASVRSLASEIQEAAMRISGLVTAIKGFTHMDQAPVAEPVDLVAGSGQHGRRAQSEGAGQVGRGGRRRRAGPAARRAASSASSTRSGRI